MFLFRLFFSLIGMVVALILMPFRLIPFSLAVVLMPLRILIRLIARNIVLVAILVIILILALALRHSNTTLPELTPAPAPAGTMPATAAPNARGAIRIDTVTKKEDGDSAFATDLYAQMNDGERAQYSQQFYQAMNTLADGAEHGWTSGNIAGTIRANDHFTGSGGGSCRHFNEALKVHTIQQTLSGTACVQSDGSWCKLKPNATTDCGLSGPNGFFGNIGSSLKNLF